MAFDSLFLRSTLSHVIRVKSKTFFFQTLSEVGTVHTVLDSGDIRVRYPSNHIWTMNPDTVVKVRVA